MTDVREHALGSLVAALCAYEVLALLLPRGVLPPISHLCWDACATRRGRLVVWAALGALAYHILGCGPGARPRCWPR